MFWLEYTLGLSCSAVSVEKYDWLWRQANTPMQNAINESRGKDCGSLRAESVSKASAETEKLQQDERPSKVQPAALFSGPPERPGSVTETPEQNSDPPNSGIFKMDISEVNRQQSMLTQQDPAEGRACARSDSHRLERPLLARFAAEAHPSSTSPHMLLCTQSTSSEPP